MEHSPLLIDESRDEAAVAAMAAYMWGRVESPTAKDSVLFRIVAKPEGSSILQATDNGLSHYSEYSQEGREGKGPTLAGTMDRLMKNGSAGSALQIHRLLCLGYCKEMADERTTDGGPTLEMGSDSRRSDGEETAAQNTEDSGDSEIETRGKTPDAEKTEEGGGRHETGTVESSRAGNRSHERKPDLRRCLKDLCRTMRLRNGLIRAMKDGTGTGVESMKEELRRTAKKLIFSIRAGSKWEWDGEVEDDMTAFAIESDGKIGRTVVKTKRRGLGVAGTTRAGV